MVRKSPPLLWSGIKTTVGALDGSVIFEATDAKGDAEYTEPAYSITLVLTITSVLQPCLVSTNMLGVPMNTNQNAFGLSTAIPAFRWVQLSWRYKVCIR